MLGKKSRRYLGYAVGELVLLVFGILIALQVNTWNEERKLRIKEIDIYREIQDDLRSTRTELEKDMTSHISIARRTEIVRDHLMNKLP